MKHDLCLRFDDEVSAIGALPQFHDGRGWCCASDGHALDPIGPIPPVTGPAEGAGDGRFHVNLQIDDDMLAESLAGHRVYPAQRRRVWA
jgi:hypothetical protein